MSQRMSATLQFAVVVVFASISPFALAQRGQARPAQQPPPSGATGMLRFEKAYPTDDRNTSMLLLERFTPAEVRAGTEFEYQIRLTNLTSGTVENITLVETFAATYRARQAGPRPERQDGNSATWRIPRLGPSEVLVIRVVGSTDRQDEMTWCANLTFTTDVCAKTRVVVPRLTLTKELPPEVLLCDTIPMRMVITNTGTGRASNIVVTDPLPAGLSTPDGKTTLTYNVGDLAAGQSREMVATLKANRTGSYTNVAKATEEGGLAAEASARVVVSKPNLVVTKRGPDVRYIGRSAQFDIAVTNDGDGPARDVVLVDEIPAGLEFTSADGGGQFANGRVTWQMGTLAAGASRTVRLVVNPRRAGSFTNSATVTAYCTEASATAPLEVRGIPAILLEVVDISDPIEVGADETYEISVVNQGSAEDTNIRITCTLPEQMEYVSSSGPTYARVSGKTVTFDPLPNLPPRMKATFKVVARGLKEGDIRFKAVMQSDQTTTIVEETESTHIY